MKKELHPRNLHNDQYDFDALAEALPKLKDFLSNNKYGNLSVNFSDPEAVLTLNQALLKHHYQIASWNIPKGHLCPPIPGRVDYIHHIADLITHKDQTTPPTGPQVKGLDIGTGTGCIYPILGHSSYGWKFVGTDISSEAVNNCKEILGANPSLKKNVKVRIQRSSDDIFANILQSDEKYDFSMCNPPFFASLKEAQSASKRKVKNLNINKEKKGHGDTKINEKQASNFGGKEYELWYPGGEMGFITKMIEQSAAIKQQVRWFTTLVSNKEHLPELKEVLFKFKSVKVHSMEMRHGNKIVHILCWKFDQPKAK